MLKIITVCGESHLRFLPHLSERIKKSCKIAGIDYSHLIDTGKGFPSVARNRLLKLINDDDIVAFMDADDYPTDNWASVIIKSIKLHNVIYSDYIYYETGDIYHSRKFDYLSFKKKNYIPFSTVVMEGSIAKQIRFKPIYYGEDWVYMHEVCKLTRNFYYISEPLVVRRINTSTNKSNIPIFRKLKRLYRNFKVKLIIENLCF